MGFVASAPIAGGNETVEVRKPLAGNRSLYSGPFVAMIFPADLTGRSVTSVMAQQYRYGIQLPPGFALVDDAGTHHAVAGGDVLLWARFPEQDLPLSEPSIDSVAAYGPDVVTYYFLELAGGPQANAR